MPDILRGASIGGSTDFVSPRVLQSAVSNLKMPRVTLHTVRRVRAILIIDTNNIHQKCLPFIRCIVRHLFSSSVPQPSLTRIDTLVSYPYRAERWKSYYRVH
jgi:hypothetical protein